MALTTEYCAVVNCPANVEAAASALHGTDMEVEVTLILVVDDDDDLRQCLATSLSARGFDVRTACNGREALDYLREAGELPDAILLDLEMPVMTGRELLAILAADRILAHIPVVVISGISERFTGSVAAVLPKPVSLPKLIAVLYSAQVSSAA